MKAVRIRSFGGSDQVQVENVPLPALAPGRALIRVVAAGVNPVDWMIREKIYNPVGADQVPMTLGQDFSGVIDRIPPGTETELREGDEVLGETFGAFAEFVAVPIRDVVRKPAGLDFTNAAALPLPALTAWQAVVDTGRAAAGMRFLIHGASGGVGSLAAQFAKLKGAEVFATASPSSFEYLRSIGIDRVLDYHTNWFDSGITEVEGELARQRIFDVVLDPKGGETQSRSWAVLKAGGMLINLIGEIDEAAARKAGVRGIRFGFRYDTDELRKIVEMAERGEVKTHVSRVFSLDEARNALDLNQQGQSHGKVVLKVA